MLKTLSSILFCMLASQAIAAQKYPFVGKWDCEVSNFTFTNATYNNGTDTLRITKAKKVGSTYELSFADGYKISVGAITARTMSWLSGATGDSCSYKRLDR